MPRLPLAILASLALACVGLFAAGCGSSDKGSDSTSQSKTAATKSADASGSASTSKTNAVEMKNVKFVPAAISVKVGQKITWTNNDGFAHNVTSTSGEKIDSGNIDGGKTYEFTPKKAGTIAYTCTLHSDQNGTITVTK